MRTHRAAAMIIDSWKAFGGGERWSLDLGGQLADECDVVVTCVDRTLAARAVDAGFEFRSLRYWGRQNHHLATIGHLLLLPLILADHLRCHRRAPAPRYVHIVTFEDQMLCTALHRVLGARVTWSVHGPPAIRNRVQLWSYRLSARLAAHIIAVSDGIRETLVALGLDPTTISVVRNGVDLPPEADDVDRSGPLRVGLVGRLESIKDPGLFLSMAQAAGRRTDVQFVLYGTGSMAAELHGRVVDDELDNVVLAGHRSDVREIYTDLSVLVLTSRSEGLPFAVLEAAAAGIPCVSVDLPASRELIVDGETGLICSRDPADLAAAVIRLTDDETYRRRLGDAARERVATDFRRETSLTAAAEIVTGDPGSDCS